MFKFPTIRKQNFETYGIQLERVHRLLNSITNPSQNPTFTGRQAQVVDHQFE